nr:MAG TPA: hypothetical protein [Caudoviricetes sp.]
MKIQDISRSILEVITLKGGIWLEIQCICCLITYNLITCVFIL